MSDTEITWYKALVLITSALAIGVGIASMVYFNKIRVDGNCGTISSGTATTMVWLNLILVILAAVIFFWSLFRLIFSHESKTPVNTNYNLHTHIHPEPDALPIGTPLPSSSIQVPVSRNAPGSFSALAEQGIF